jgi:hypothetical protein
MGKMAEHLTSVSNGGRLKKPSLQIDAYVSAYPPPAPYDNTKYLKEDQKRLTKEVAAIKQALDNWVPEDVAERAEKSLRRSLKDKKAQLESIEEQLSEKDEEEDDEEEN